MQVLWRRASCSLALEDAVVGFADTGAQIAAAAAALPGTVVWADCWAVPALSHGYLGATYVPVTYKISNGFDFDCTLYV